MLPVQTLAERDFGTTMEQKTWRDVKIAATTELKMSTDVYSLRNSHVQSSNWLPGCHFRQDTRTKASVDSRDSRVRAIALTLTGNLQDHRCLAPSSHDLIDWYSPRPGNTSPSPKLECRVIGSDPGRTPACLRSAPKVTRDKCLGNLSPAPRSWPSQGECPLRRGRKPRLLLWPNLEVYYILDRRYIDDRDISVLYIYIDMCVCVRVHSAALYIYIYFMIYIYIYICVCGRLCKYFICI